jgi:hypothetical protein
MKSLRALICAITLFVLLSGAGTPASAGVAVPSPKAPPPAGSSSIKPGVNPPRGVTAESVNLFEVIMFVLRASVLP